METNTNNAAISIIIPHWENIDGLEILLESIHQEASKYPNLSETIVVDDYSCPETQQKLRDLRNKFDFRLYFNNSIKSAGTCRNIGIEKSIGQWLLFADSDDYFLPNFLDATQKYQNSDYDIVFFPPTSVEYNNHNIISNRHINHVRLLKNFKPNQQSELDIRYRWPEAWSRLIRKSVVINNSIKFESVIASNDAFFTTLLGFWASKITIDESKIYVATSRQDSLTQDPTLNNLLSRIEVHIRINRFLSKHKLDKYKKSYWEWLLPILVYFGVYELFKAMFFIVKNHDNPIWGFNDRMSRLFLIIKKKKFKEIAIRILQKRHYIQ